MKLDCSSGAENLNKIDLMRNISVSLLFRYSKRKIIFSNFLVPQMDLDIGIYFLLSSTILFDIHTFLLDKNVLFCFVFLSWYDQDYGASKGNLVRLLPYIWWS